MIEVREVLRGWLGGGGLRTVAERAGVDRKTARRYVQAAQEAGLTRPGDPAAAATALTDELIGAVVERVRPVRPNGHGTGWEALGPRRDDVTAWVREGLSIVKIHELLVRSGTGVPYRTVHRFASAQCGFTGRRRAVTVRVADGEPGVECQIDFAQMGFLPDPESGRRRRVHALIFTAVLSRHMYVHLSYGQRLDDVVAGCEAAWAYFGGVFRVLIPDNLKPVVTASDPTSPRLSLGWLDYSQHAGFVTDPARVRSPQDKPRVERAVQYVRGNFWAGETFTDRAAAQTAVTAWCTKAAGMRLHGTLAARPLEVFTEREAAALLPVPAVYDVPILRTVKVHRDHHVEIAKALYSVPTGWIGTHLDARADAVAVKLYHRGQLIKTHPRQRPGGRSTEAADLPAERVGYAMRDLDRLKAVADGHGPNIGIYVYRLLDDPLPWTRMRAVYRLLGLVRRHGVVPVENACSTALDLDVISVTKIAAMLAKALETTPPDLPAGGGDPNPASSKTGRFARRPDEFATRTTRSKNPARQLTLVPTTPHTPDPDTTDPDSTSEQETRS